MRSIIVVLALLAPSLAFADGYGYQGDDSADSGYSGFNYQTPPDWTPPPPPSVFGPLYDSDDN